VCSCEDILVKEICVPGRFSCDSGFLERFEEKMN
jgi:hypothetical protein